MLAGIAARVEPTKNGKLCTLNLMQRHFKVSQTEEKTVDLAEFEY